MCGKPSDKRVVHIKEAKLHPVTTCISVFFCVPNGIREPYIEVTCGKLLFKYGGGGICGVCVWYHICHGYVMAHMRDRASDMI